MLEKSEWYFELITLLHTSDKFGCFTLDKIIDLAEYCYTMGCTPELAFQWILTDWLSSQTGKKTSRKETEEEEETPLSWEEQNLLPVIDLNPKGIEGL